MGLLASMAAIYVQTIDLVFEGQSLPKLPVAVPLLSERSVSHPSSLCSFTPSPGLVPRVLPPSIPLVSSPSSLFFISPFSPAPVLCLGAHMFSNADFLPLIPVINCGYGRYDSLICDSVVVVVVVGRKIGHGGKLLPLQSVINPPLLPRTRSTATRATQQKSIWRTNTENR